MLHRARFQAPCQRLSRGCNKSDRIFDNGLAYRQIDHKVVSRRERVPLFPQMKVYPLGLRYSESDTKASSVLRVLHKPDNRVLTWLQFFFLTVSIEI